MAEPIRLAVLTPSLTGQVHIEHGEAIADLRVQCLKRGIAFRRFYNKGSSVLCKNRNALTQTALDAGADYILWVDGDIAFRADDVFRLMDWNKAIIAGAAQKRTHKWGEPGAMMLDGDLVRDAEGLLNVRRVGTGFLLVRAEVYRRMADEGLAPEYFTRDGAKGELRMHKWFWFDVDADGYDVGEDYYFCNQAKRLGYECFVDPDVRLSHFEGLVEHSLCLSDIMEAMNGNDHASGPREPRPETPESVQCG
jgi:hypothetical protein